MSVCSWRAERPRLWRPLLCDASVTTQRSARCGFFHALSHPRPGLFSPVGQKWAELVPDPLSNSIPDRRGSPTPPNATTAGLPTPIRGLCTLSHPHDEAERPSDDIEERRKNHTERPPRASRSRRQMFLGRSLREFLERSGPAQPPATLSRSVRSRSPGQGPSGVKGIQRCLPASPSLR